MTTESVPGTATAPGGRLRAVAAAIAVIVVGFVLGGALTIGLALALDVSGVTVSLTAATVLGLVVLQGIAFPLTALGYLRYRGVKFGSFVGTRLPTFRDVAWVVGGYLLAFRVVAIVLYVVTATGVPTAERTDQAALQDPGTLLWLVPLAFLLIGPGEELLFRGIVQGRLRESFGAVGSVVLSSASFAPVHILALSGSLQALGVTVAVLFVPALVFGAAYERTNNLLVPILIHGSYNATLFGLAYFVARYAPSQPGLL